jgi:hypothetical protein
LFGQQLSTGGSPIKIILGINSAGFKNQLTHMYIFFMKLFNSFVWFLLLFFLHSSAAAPQILHVDALDAPSLHIPDRTPRVAAWS